MEIIRYLRPAPNLSLAGRKGNETKVVVEYCWTITQVAADQVPASWSFILNWKSFFAKESYINAFI